MEKEKLKRKRKIIFFVLVVIFIAIIIKLLPLFMSLLTPEGRRDFGKNITSLGIVGMLQILLLEICKAVVVFLPAEPIELLSGMCFGPIWGTIIVYIGIVISTVIVFLSVKKYGQDIVEDIIPEEKFTKIKNMLHNNSDKFEVILFVLYFLPVVPKDFLNYIAGLLPIGMKKFLILAMFARFPAVISSTIVGNSLLEGDIKTIILAYGITYAISFLIAFTYNKKFKKSVKEKKIQEKRAS